MKVYIWFVSVLVLLDEMRRSQDRSPNNWDKYQIRVSIINRTTLISKSWVPQHHFKLSGTKFDKRNLPYFIFILRIQSLYYFFEGYFKDFSLQTRQLGYILLTFSKNRFSFSTSDISVFWFILRFLIRIRSRTSGSFISINNDHE